MNARNRNLNDDEAADAFGIVDLTRKPITREPLVIPQPPEDQSQPGPWWIVPAFAIMALALVFATYLVAEAMPLVGGL